MNVDIEKIKEANPIEEIVAETHPLRGTGRYLRAEAHDSLVVDTHNQAYFWNSKGEHGDVIAWVQQYRNVDFKEAVAILCRRAGLPVPQWRSEDSKAALAARARYDALTVAGRFFVRRLRDENVGDVARRYCCSRGWSDETIRAAGLGFTGPDYESDLRGEFQMHEIDPKSPAARAVMKIGPGMLIYPHVLYGRVVYLSARSIEGKRHYNPEAELVGDRRLYFNWLYSPREDSVVVVEGQADAITLGQWGVPAMALAGVAINQHVLQALARHHVIVALDQDEAGRNATRKLADALPPMTQIASWPDAQDANEWLQGGGKAEDCRALLTAAPTWAMLLATEAGAAENGTQMAALKRAFLALHRLGEFELATQRKELANAMGLGLREFDRMLKAVAGEAPAAEGGEPLVTLPLVGGQIQMKDDPENYYLLEMVYQPPEGSAGAEALSGGKTLFAVRDPDGKIYTATHLDLNNVRYLPYPPHSPMLTKRVVSFAQDIGPLLKTGVLVDEIQKVIHQYVDLDPFFERLSAYYVLFTWMYDCFNTIPYIRFRGDYGTGKSRARKVIGALCFRPMRASGAATVSPIFRMIDAWRGSLLVEEADYSASDYAQEIIKIYNQGYDREQGIVLRSGDKATGFETEAFVCFGPKIVAMRGEFHDRALTSRFLTKEMTETTRTDIPIEMPREFELEEAPRLRAMLLRYRLEHWRPYIELNYDALDLSIEPRLNQITLALYSLVDDEELMADLKAFVKEYNKRLIDERGLTLAAKVLESLVLQHALETSYKDDERDWDLSTLTLTKRANQLIDFENHGYEGYLDHHFAQRNKTEVSDRKVGSVIRTQLQLVSERASRFNGRHVVQWDEQRVDGLRKRYGLDDDRLVDLLEIVQKLDAMEAEAQAECDRANTAEQAKIRF